MLSIIFQLFNHISIINHLSIFQSLFNFWSVFNFRSVFNIQSLPYSITSIFNYFSIFKFNHFSIFDHFSMSELYMYNDIVQFSLKIAYIQYFHFKYVFKVYDDYQSICRRKYTTHNTQTQYWSPIIGRRDWKVTETLAGLQAKLCQMSSGETWRHPPQGVKFCIKAMTTALSIVIYIYTVHMRQIIADVH